MRRVRAAIVVVAVSVMSLAFTGPAAAGGPTSVLLVQSETSKAVSLYYTDADYEALADLVGVNKPVEAATADRAGGNRDVGGGVTLTWLVHDVAVWRVDRVYLGGKGGPWIATQSDMNASGNLYDSPVTWHRATDGPGLVAFLERRGFGAGSTAGAGSADAAIPGPAAVVEPAQIPSRPASPTPTWGGWAWGLVGLALGVALATAAVPVVMRVRRAAASRTATEPFEPEETTTPTDVACEPAWTPSDELSWSAGPRG